MPARVTLGVTSLLTLSTQVRASKTANKPLSFFLLCFVFFTKVIIIFQVSNLMLAPSLLSFDWWMSFCSKIICILLFWDLPDLLMTIANGSRTRWKDFLFPVQRVSLEAFQLCALAKTQQWNPHSPPAIIITVKHFSKWKDLFQNQDLLQNSAFAI